MSKLSINMRRMIVKYTDICWLITNWKANRKTRKRCKLNTSATWRQSEESSIESLKATFAWLWITYRSYHWTELAATRY